MRPPRAVVTLAVLGLVLAPLALPASAHFQVRHIDHPAGRSGPGDAIWFLNGPARWKLVTPTLEVLEFDGPVLEVPPGLPYDATWTVHAIPRSCDRPGPFGIAWQLGAYNRSAEVPYCGDTTWMFNWYPKAFPPPPDLPYGTALLYGPQYGSGDLRELQEFTYYQGATPYYNMDENDGHGSDYELLAGNAHPYTESNPTSDPDGDGIPNRGDAEWWVGVWLAPWLAAHGLPAPPLPRADLLAEDVLREAARAAPSLEAQLREDVAYATSDTRGEGAAQTPLGATERLAFTVRNARSTPSVNGMQPFNRFISDVLLDVPGGFAVDLAGTRAAAPPGWTASLWRDAHGARLLFQSDWDHSLRPNRNVTLPVVARAGAVGAEVWDATLLAGPLAPERRYAFLDAEVVA